ncbi:MAG: 5-(carboxyamino)imidazole ribonucleotide synthase [Chloroflexi bacterium]|nr:5-(carboxyamino)imidazole ribonucleotide synthase [Chloroflexota bacterium]MCC6891604.1 5-(carboxyamino)imidazole ribonucleotide synthase [Anaerolineae bacterium]
MKFATIGILGGGQLGRMMAFDAQRMGMKVIVLDPDSNAPAGQVANQHIIGSFRDPQKITELAKLCDVVTVEIEHVDADALETLEQQGVVVQPSARTIQMIQDKYAQKAHFAHQNIPLAPFIDVPDEQAAYQTGEQLGYPFVLKAKRLAYDGRGNVVVNTRDDVPQAVKALGGRELYAEGWIAFTKELAVMIGRGLDGQVVAYPVVETIQKDNICHTVSVPASIPPRSVKQAQAIALKAISSLDGAGIFGVELFLQADGQVLLNEVAPRPHNSGHYTIEACSVSQFEQHLRAITGLPLGDTRLRVPAAVMVNILGQETSEATQELVDQAITIPGTSLHWYGKGESRPQRKMGHVTLTGETLDEVTQKLIPLTTNTIQARPDVGIIMGSDSDLPVMKQAAQILKDFGVAFELTIVSAHRTPQRMFDYAQTAHERGLKVIIAGAGGAAHLPGMVAAITPLPVIGVPVRIEPMDGQDALFSIVQMPRGIPVATVAIGNATNAGLLAVRILASQRPELLQKMQAYQASLEAMVLQKAEKIEQNGWE